MNRIDSDCRPRCARCLHRVRYRASMHGNRELAERFIATLEARDWDAWAGLLHPGVVYEIPQSRERIRGRDRYLRFNQEYPGDWHLRPKVAIADERHGVVWFEWVLDGHPGDAMAFFEFAPVRYLESSLGTAISRGNVQLTASNPHTVLLLPAVHRRPIIERMMPAQC